jgi:glutathione peroxidase
MKKITYLLTIIILTVPVLLSAQKSFHDYTVKDINGFNYELSQLKGKKVLVVNTASKCGLTPQYEDLEMLYRQYKDKGLVILGFPSNDFAGQEPGTNEEIAAFCTEKFEVSFPMMSKISVKGDEIHPLYQWLTSEVENGLEDSKVLWNFQKYMIDENGTLVGHVAPQKKPDTKEIIKWLEKS